MNVVIMHDTITDAASADEADALTQAATVESALHALGHTTSRMAFGFDLAAATSELRRRAPDLVFNLVESVGGHGRLIHLAPSLLDALRIPYAGCPTDAVFTSSNKLLAKTLMKGAGIPTPAWMSASDASDDEHDGRYILKSVWEHASRGIDDDSIIEVKNAAQLSSALDRSRERLAGEGLAEKYIDGREFNLAFLADGRDGARSLPPAEIEFVGYAPGKPRIVGYSAKWAEGSFEYENTPRRFEFESADRPLVDAMVELGKRCWRLFGLRGWARVDFRVDESGRPWVLEVNSNPCLSPDAGFAAAVGRAGITMTDAISRILGQVQTMETRRHAEGH